MVKSAQREVSAKWSDIFEAWQSSMSMLEADHVCSSSLVQEVRVKDYPMYRALGKDSSDGAFDWWPSRRIKEIRREMEQGGAQGTFKGTCHTASLLWRTRRDPESMAAVWILAFCHDAFRSLPDPWRGSVFRQISAIVQPARAWLEAKDINTHWPPNSKDAMPVPAIRRLFEDAFVPPTMDMLVYVILLEAIVSCAAYTPIRAVAPHAQRFFRM